MAALESQVGDVKSTLESTLSGLQETEIKQREIGALTDKVRDSATSAIESIEILSETNDQVAEVKAQTRKISELAKEASDQAADILETVESANLKGSAKQSFLQIKGIIEDDIDDKKQLGELVAALTELQRRGAIPIEGLQMGQRTLSAKYDQLVRENDRIMETLKRIEAR